jgi:glycogen operon protein
MDALTPDRELDAGRPWPLGSRWDGEGVNFALFSAHAEAVDLCVFDAGTARGVYEFPLPACTDQVWHGYLRGAGPGLRYAFRVRGPQLPGHRFDPTRLLLDPYAREVDGVFAYGAKAESPGLRACVVDERSERYDWGSDAPPLTPLADSVLYEIHVKGATQTHPGVPAKLRGTYAGLASAPFIAYLKKLGVTAVNLLPVQGFLDEERLVKSGRVNYWGYNTITFFAPEPRYAARIDGQPAIAEFRAMVRALHAAGIEVILDVVYNHTAETDEFGPTISFRGIDNASYYKLPDGDRNAYVNFTGCGNTFDLAQPRVLQLVMDSLRYWVAEMHVDGFRFDLATVLTRGSGFLAAVRQDPLLARVKLIAEPWDLGPDGYRVGRFPPGWSEWNDGYRDEIRSYWLTGTAGPGALAHRLAGSSEVFRHAGRAPQASVNFITAHDGFTLRDLVSYRNKHNEANGEGNRDGHGHNHSTNCGVEGETDDPAVVQQRALLQRALLSTLFVSRGVPMLQGGDEIGRTQGGNNNAYCQDNSMTWLAWPNADLALADFTAELVALRRRFAQLSSTRWLTGGDIGDGRRDIVWWHPEGRELNVGDWQQAHAPALGFVLADERPTPKRGPALLVLFNRGASELAFTLPPGRWTQHCDSGRATPFASVAREGQSPVGAFSVQILSQD